MSALLTALSEPLGYAFFTRGLAVATLAGALCGLIGVFIVLRGMSYIGHGLSHAVLGGYAASAVLGFNLLLGAGVWGLLSALAINAVTRRRRIGADAAIGVVTTASFALGVALLSRFGSSGPSFDNLLFGSILGTTTRDVVQVGAVFALALAGVVLLYRPLLFSTFDPDVAAVSGVRVARIEAGLMVVLSLAILTTLGTIGVTLVAATLVVPAVIARMLTDSFGRMLALSTVVGTLGGFTGMYASYYLEIPSGTTIVLTEALVFLVVLALTGPRRLRRVASYDAHPAELVLPQTVAAGR